jgi:HME family heavy-metal exporter
VFTIAKQPHVDTRAITDRIEAALKDVEASLPADMLINSELFRLKNFIDRGVFNVGEALVIGAVLVVIVLFLFLMNLRTTFITPTAIPLRPIGATPSVANRFADTRAPTMRAASPSPEMLTPTPG